MCSEDYERKVDYKRINVKRKSAQSPFLSGRFFCFFVFVCFRRSCLFSLFWIVFCLFVFFFIMPFVFISFVLSVGLFYFNMRRFVSIVFCNLFFFYFGTSIFLFSILIATIWTDDIKNCWIISIQCLFNLKTMKLLTEEKKDMSLNIY